MARYVSPASARIEVQGPRVELGSVEVAPEAAEVGTEGEGERISDCARLWPRLFVPRF